jgi:hypothetical protein
MNWILNKLNVYAGIWITFGVVLGLMMFDYWRVQSRDNLYIEPENYMLIECEKRFVGRCRMYALPEAAAGDFWDAVQPYRDDQ